MPVINLAGQLGGAGDAAAAVTQQLNFGMQQQLQLAQLQQERWARQQDLAMRERAFLAQMDSVDFTQQAQLRAEQRQLRLDDRILEQSNRDYELRAQALADETALKNRDLEIAGRLADARISAMDNEAGAAAAQRNLAGSNLAGQVSRALNNEFPVSASGVLGMLRDLWNSDAKNGTNHAETWEATLHQLTDGEYRDLAPEEIEAKLQTDPRLFNVYTGLGQAVLGVRQGERAKLRGTEMVSQIGGLRARISALGDKRLLDEFDTFTTLGVPQEGTPDGAFLDYADGEFIGQLAEWKSRVSLAENKSVLRGELDRLKKSKDQAWWVEPINQFSSSSKTRAEIIGAAQEDIEKAETVDEARGALARVMPVLDPMASMVYDVGQRQALGAMGRGARGEQASGAFTGRSAVDPEEEQLYDEALKIHSLDAPPEKGSLEERAVAITYAGLLRRHRENAASQQGQQAYQRARRLEGRE